MTQVRLQLLPKDAADKSLARIAALETDERDLLENGASEVGRLLHAWSATPSWPDAHAEATYRAAMLLLNTAHCSLEYHRWALRGIGRYCCACAGVRSQRYRIPRLPLSRRGPFAVAVCGFTLLM